MKKTLSLLMAAGMAMAMFAGCGSTSTAASADTASSTAEAASSSETTEASSSEAAAEPTTPDNTITGDASAADAFVFWMWNDDAKKILEGPFKEDCPDDFARVVYVNCGGSDYYQQKIDALLEDPSNQLYPDMMALEIDYVQKYVQSGYLLSADDLGITADDLKNQYDFNKTVCTNSDDGKQYAFFWQATPGCWQIRADLAEQYLGTTDPAELQAMFATWGDVEATAAKVHEASGGNCELLSGWDDICRVYTNNRKVGWYDDNDKIAVDDQVKAYFEEAKKFYDNNWSFNTVQWKPDWYSMMAGSGTSADSKAALAYTGCPWFTYWCLDKDAWTGNTILIDGPQSFYWGGSGLAATTECSDKELAARILKYFTCDTESMKKISAFNFDFVNNQEANEQLAAEGTVKSDFMYGDQDYLTAYNDILKNMTVDTSVVKAEDKGINDVLSQYVQRYLDGESYDTVIDSLKSYIHDTYSYLTL